MYKLTKHLNKRFRNSTLIFPKLQNFNLFNPQLVKINCDIRYFSTVDPSNHIQQNNQNFTEKQDDINKTGQAVATKKEIRAYLQPIIFNKEAKSILYKSTLLLALSKSLAIASPFFLKYTVNAISLGAQMDINMACLGIIGFGTARILSTVFQEIRMKQIADIIQIGAKNVSMQAFKHLHELDIYFHKVSSKNTVFAINRAIRSIESALRFTLGFFAPVGFEFVLLCGTFQLYFGFPYLANMLVTLGFYTILTKKYSTYRQNIIRERKNHEKKSEFYLNESMMNYDTVKNFNREERELRIYETLLDKLRKSAEQVQITLGRLNISQSVIFSIGMTINLLMAVQDVSLGVFTPGDFVMLQTLFIQLAGPLFNMGTLFREIDQSQVDVEDLYVMLKQESKIKEKIDAQDYQFKQGQIQLQGVSFKHMKGDNNEFNGQEKYLFKDLTLDIQPGTTNAIVGQSGFGKTTMLNLINRIYDPHEGSIILDGQDLKDLKFKSYRKYISVIPQNGILFNDTILHNLQYGNEDATFEEVVEIAKKCQIHEKILSMEKGYETQVGDLGSKLSGGERQRILIARGLLKKDAKIYLFDEATSNLDAHTERDITEALEEIMVGKTVIYCAHRLSSIINVDNIYVLADGKVAEKGTHWELMDNENSLYTEMWKNYLNEQEKEKVAEEK
ncbi:metal abc transporter permease [Stylonychia lemnae]|uniref:Metal abc transporter permease n=1 Tax=Stylonychia lemnae TaxID=5949 RepID=A0A078ARI2_STYLE|nr:metal abc transporter permease [Stylonychia lemnae]|eukprot:CDW83458.1 metal abc transporter permease [Stylonychia lemnae]